MIMIAYVCQCLYHMEKRRFYPKTCVEYVKDVLNGFYFHLDDVMIAKRNGCGVCSCIFCVKKISEKVIMFPDYLENIDNFCWRFWYCSTNIYGLFSSDLQRFRRGIEEGDIWCFMNEECGICNLCMTWYMISLKDFFMLFVIDEFS